MDAFGSLRRHASSFAHILVLAFYIVWITHYMYSTRRAAQADDVVFNRAGQLGSAARDRTLPPWPSSVLSSTPISTS